MMGKKRLDDWSLQSKLKAFEARHLEIGRWIFQTQITQEEAIKALATFCAWVQNDSPDVWLHFSCDQQAVVALPRDCAMDASVPIVKVLSYAARLASSLSCRKSLVNAVMKLPVAQRSGNSKFSNRTPPTTQHKPTVIAAGFPQDYYQLCSQALEFKELQAAIDSSVSEDLRPLTMLSAQVQALASEVATQFEEYNTLAARLEKEGIAEKLRSVNAECATFKANMQNLTRERTVVRENWVRGEEALKKVEAELREESEKIRRCQGLLATYTERISQSPEELAKIYANLMRDKSEVFAREAGRAHAQLRCARAIDISLPETQANLRGLREMLETRSSLMTALELEVGRRDALTRRAEDKKKEYTRKRKHMDDQKADLDGHFSVMQRKKELLESRIAEISRSRENLAQRELNAANRIEQINHEMARLKEEDLREIRLERQHHREVEDMRKYLSELKECLPPLLDEFDAEIQEHQEKILRDLDVVNERTLRQLMALVPSDYPKLRALKQGRICGC